MISLMAAFQFLTISPALVRRPFTASELGRAVGLFPLAGLAIGGLLLALDTGLRIIFPPEVAAALILASWIIITRGLHFDGFLDSCDALFGGFTAERRMEIMRDSRIGAFGAAGGILLILAKYATVLTLVDRPAGIILAPVLARWGMALSVVLFPYARQQGLGRDMKDNAGRAQAIIATITAVIAGWLLAQWLGLLAALLAVLLLLATVRFALARIPGLTGDIYGALCELLELFILLFFTVDLTRDSFLFLGGS
jgi:adenosylcobinamide-GDP ribazoletransferase